MSERIIWPEYPMVEIIDNHVKIFYEDGSEDVWGIEEHRDPEKVATEIRNGLRAIKFLRRSIDSVIEASLIILEEIGFSEEYRLEYLNEALQGIIPKSVKHR